MTLFNVSQFSFSLRKSYQKLYSEHSDSIDVQTGENDIQTESYILTAPAIQSLLDMYQTSENFHFLSNKY